MFEEVFGWMKAIGLERKVRHRGTARVDWMLAFTAATHTPVRMRRWLPAAAFAVAA